jgi:hypothetical protein
MIKSMYSLCWYMNWLTLQPMVMGMALVSEPVLERFGLKANRLQQLLGKCFARSSQICSIRSVLILMLV